MLDLLLPLRCAGCGADGTALCARCLAGFGRVEPVRRRPLAYGPPVYALADYAGTARTVVLSYKERGRRDLARPLGTLLASASGRILPPDGHTRWLVPVPSRRRTARARGGQHMLRLARHCAAVLTGSGQPAAVAPALRMAGNARDSVGLSADERLANLAGGLVAVADGLPPVGSGVLLLDDVVTTGATVATASSALATTGVGVTAVLSLTATAAPAAERHASPPVR